VGRAPSCELALWHENLLGAASMDDDYIDRVASASLRATSSMPRSTIYFARGSIEVDGPLERPSLWRVRWPCDSGRTGPAAFSMRGAEPGSFA